MSTPLVSVVITTFNTERYLPETLDSVLSQSHEHYEVIVVDDGSTDGSVRAAREHSPRITVLEREHEGLGPARNAGLAITRGEYVAFLDSDDVWHPDALRTQVAVAREHPESGLVVCDGVRFRGATVTFEGLCLDTVVVAGLAESPNGRFTAWAYHDFLTGCLVRCPAQALIPRRVVEDIGDVCATPNGVQDYDYYLRIARRYPVTFHSAVLVGWRERADSMTATAARDTARLGADMLCVLEREAASCAPADRDAVRAAITARARRTLVRASGARMQDGRRANRETLATVYRILPRDPVVLCACAVLALPSPFDLAILRAIRIMRRWARAAAGLRHGLPRRAA